MKKVSIIIPCYNVEKYINNCLDSIINQTYTNIEIICINDGSTDSTGDIIKSYNDNRIVYIEQKNSGVSKARNLGLSMANGEYITFVDGDDSIKVDMIEIFMQKMNYYDCDVVFCSYAKNYENALVENHIYGNEDRLIDGDNYKKLYCRLIGLTKDQLQKPELADSLCTVWGKLYKKDCIKDYEFVDLKEIGTFEDGLFNINVFVKMQKAYYINSCMYYYRKENISSITHLYKNKLYFQWSILFDYIYNFLFSNGLENDECLLEAYQNRICLSIIGLGLNELNNPNGFIERLHNLKTILNSDRYKGAYKSLELKYFPIHWKVFFIFAKKRMALFLYIMLYIINKIR